MVLIAALVVSVWHKQRSAHQAETPKPEPEGSSMSGAKTIKLKPVAAFPEQARDATATSSPRDRPDRDRDRAGRP